MKKDNSPKFDPTVLAISGFFVPYVKELYYIFGGVEEALMFRHMLYWSEKNDKGFYKLMVPNVSDDQENTGDSWQEELGWSKKVISRVVAKLVFKRGKKVNDAIAKEIGSTDRGKIRACRIELESRALFISYTDSDRKTWYIPNIENINKIVRTSYDRDLSVDEIGGLGEYHPNYGFQLIQNKLPKETCIVSDERELTTITKKYTNNSLSNDKECSQDKAEGSVDVHIANPPPGGNDREGSTGECKPGDFGYAKNSQKRLTSAPPEKPSKKSANTPSERALEIEENFHKILEETFPRIADDQDEKSRTEQAAEVDKCVRLDKVDYDEVEKAVMWAATNHFWKDNFRSLKKLRKPDKYGTKYVLYFLDKAENEKQDECPYGEIVKIYREFEKKEDVHWLPAPPKLGYTKFLIRRAWEEWADKDVEWFRKLFARCARSQFLSNNEKRIFFSLEWILREEKYCNLVQGRYDH